MSYTIPTSAGYGFSFKRLFSGLSLVLLGTGISQAQPCTQAPQFANTFSDITVNAGPNLCAPLINFPGVLSNPNNVTLSHLFTGATSGSGGGLGSGLAFNKGFTHVVVTASNACGTTTRSFNINVKDVTGPTLMHADITVPSEQGLCGAHVNFLAPTVTDNCPDCNLASLAGLVAAGFTPLGPNGGLYSGTGHYYFMTPAITSDNFEIIETVAGAIGGHLVSINDAGEQAFIDANVPSSTLAWIGLTDRDQEGTFRWVDGTPFGPSDYQNWCNQQPDDQGGNLGFHQNYVLIHSGGTVGNPSCWDDGHSPFNALANLDNKFVGILEIDACGTSLVQTAGLHSDDFFPVGTSQVTYEGKDAFGNVTTYTFNIHVTGAAVPCNITVTPSNNTYTGGIPTNIYLGYGPQSATVSATSGGPGATYAWSGTGASKLSSTSVQSPVFTPTAPGTYTLSVTVTPVSGCASTCNVTFCVKNVLASALGVSCGNPNQVRVVICHRPPGNPTNVQIQCHQLNAVDADLRNHGDGLGLCDDLCATTARVLRNNANISVIGDEVKVYPNPTTNTFYMELPYFETSATVTLTDIQGKVLETRSFVESDDHKVRFDLANNPRGMYLLNVSYDDHRFRTKVVLD